MYKKLAISIRSSFKSPYLERSSECIETWGRYFNKNGSKVFSCFGIPDLECLYKKVGNSFFSRVTDGKDGVFEKTVVNPCRWLSNDSDKDYLFVTDCDTFVHPRRFIEALYNNIKDFKEVDYVGCKFPCTTDFDHFTYQRLFIEPSNNFWASGGSGFILSRKAAKIIVDAFDSKDYLSYHGFNNGWFYYDDVFVANILCQKGIRLLHDSGFYFESPFNYSVVDLYQRPVPYILNQSYLHTQHYLCGKMNMLMKELQIS